MVDSSIRKERIIRKEVETTATPEQVYQAWADPERLSQWFVDRASGDVKPGGVYNWTFEEFGYNLSYTVEEAEPGRKLVLGFRLPGRPEGVIDVDISTSGGKTVLRLVNSGFGAGDEWEDEYRGTVSGWRMMLDILKHYLENYFGRDKHSMMIMRPADFEYERLQPFFHEGKGLARWLTRQGAIGSAGDAVALQLRDGQRLTGQVLSVTDRETQVSWRECEGVLGLKAFAMNPGRRMVGLHFVTWGGPSHAERQRPVLEAAAERLAGLLKER